MKKLVLTSVCALAVTAGAFAQGLVNWQAISFANMTAQTNATVASTFAPGSLPGGGTIGGAGTLTPGGFYYALLYSSYTGVQASAPTTAAQMTAAGWQAAGPTATNSGTAGRLFSTPSNNGLPVAGFVPGVTNSVMMAGWSANLGTTWTAAWNTIQNWATQSAGVVGPAFFGLSNTGYIATLDNSTVPGVTVFGINPTAAGLPIQSLNTQLFQLSAVPEPGTLALAALGGASLLLFRRKK
jgi:hypothetical protein